MKSIQAIALAGFVVFLASCGTTDPYRSYPNMIADMDPIPIGAAEAQLERTFSSKLNTYEITVVFYPRLNAVALEFRYDFITYRQFWDETARQQFAGALELYKADYAERKLTDRYSRTRAVYGRAQGRVEWETFRYSETYVAHPMIGLGYRFRSNSPFFATQMQRSPIEVKDTGDDSGRTDSQQVNMYFTRAQADDLVKLFDQEYLEGLLSGIGASGRKEPVNADDYMEFRRE